MKKSFYLVALLLIFPFLLKAIPIHDIQYVPNPTVNDTSPYIGQTVTISGIVSFVYQNSSGKTYFYVQDSSGAWNGILGYSPTVTGDSTLKMGDSITATGAITEYYGTTELNYPDVTIYKRGLTPYAPVYDSTGNIGQEKYEGVLVQIRNAVVSNSSTNSCDFNDGSGSIEFYDKGNVVTSFPSNGDAVLSATGEVDWFSIGSIYEVYPRGDFDIVKSLNGSGTVIMKPDTLSTNDTLDIAFDYTPNVDTSLGILQYTQIYLPNALKWDSSSTNVELTGDFAGATVSFYKFSNGAYYINISGFSLKSSGKIVIKNIATDTITGSFTMYTKTGIDSSSAEYISPNPVMVIKTSAGMGKAMVNPYYIKTGIKNDFKIAITPTTDTALFNINYVELTIPSGLTWDSIPEINVSKGTYTLSGDGSDSLPYIIKWDNADVIDTSYIRLTNVTADSSLTSISFSIKTGKDSNDIALCSANSVHINNTLFDSLISIGEAQNPGSDGYTSGMVNQTVKVKGFVTGPSKYFNPTTTSTSFYIQDSTGGIDVFSPSEAASLSYTLGKEIIVTGVITEYNGLTELKYDDSTKITVISDSGAILQPEALPVSAGLNENREGMLLEVQKGIVASTPYQSGTGYNMQIWNGQAIIDIRINNSTGIPDAALFKNLKNGDYLSIAGIEGQYDKTAPYTTGYQLMPRFIEDLSLYTPSDTTTEMGIKLYPNPFRPDNGEMLNIEITGPQNAKYDLKLYDLKGRLIKTFAENVSSGNTVYWWNGRDEHDSYLNIGAYVLVYTLKLPDGSRKRINKAVVIGTQLN